MVAVAILAVVLQPTASPAAIADHAAPVAARQLAVPVVVGHRGAPGHRPEHTLASYRLAIDLGADYIEPDLVSTKDGVLIARHDDELTSTTDVADHPEFADRKTTKTIYGVERTGWFAEDFTLAEIKTLRARESASAFRQESASYDDRFKIATFDEVLRLVKKRSRELGRVIGVAPETKFPSYFDSIGLSLEEPLVRSLRAFHLDLATSPVVIQSFEVGNLRQLNRRIDVPLVQLVAPVGAPYDLMVKGSATTYATMTTPAGLATVAKYADWLAPDKDMVLPRDPDTGATGVPSALVGDAHRAGLYVVIYVIRNENAFMATNFRVGSERFGMGDVHAEITAFLDAGVDAFFADFPESGVQARDDWVAAHRS
ncbi:unannotated protein [freshwater metagenome]|uniref:glycerophosphodiester phosphodiesterase n=1 Tax=freshwater metagenome TaxID=449393 RepID=A0A6J6QLF9_9ZZZZ